MTKAKKMNLGINNKILDQIFVFIKTHFYYIINKIELND